MATDASATAVRDYLKAVKDPGSLRNDDLVGQLRGKLESSDDSLERLRLRQQLLDAQSPSIERYEEGFITHAKGWAEGQGIGVKAFSDEGVTAAVLRKAGFAVPGGRGRASSTRTAAPRARRSRVTVEEVRSAIPAGAFTIKQLQEASGASPAVVRKVVSEEEQAGRLQSAGTDPDHRGPGRAPILYRRS